MKLIIELDIDEDAHVEFDEDYIRNLINDYLSEEGFTFSINSHTDES